MAYNKFTLEMAVEKLGLIPDDWHEPFKGINRREPSPLLEETLDENLIISVSIGTEKARSELVIAPVLLDVRRHTGKKISFFSGRKFDIDPDLSLVGTCDFLISKSPNQRLVEAPVIAITEAKKNDSLEDGVGQCAAEMYAAQLFNLKKNKPIPIIYGVVTSGDNWKFLKLEGKNLYIQPLNTSISEISLILGILDKMVE